MTPRNRPIGRPSLFTTELGDEICNRIADGESLRAICDEADMPDKATVFRWLSAEGNKDFRNQYIRAREAQADSLVDDILSIADDARNDWMKRNGENATGYQENGEVLRRSALRIDARKWLAGKMLRRNMATSSRLNTPPGRRCVHLGGADNGEPQERMTLHSTRS